MLEGVVVVGWLRFLLVLIKVIVVEVFCCGKILVRFLCFLIVCVCGYGVYICIVVFRLLRLVSICVS